MVHISNKMELDLQKLTSKAQALKSILHPHTV